MRRCTDAQSKASPSPSVFVQSGPASQRKASLPAAKNEIHRKQSSYISHCLCEWARRSPVERNKMTCMATVNPMETSESEAWARRRLLYGAVDSLQSMTKVSGWGAMAVELWGTNDSRLKLSMSSANCSFFSRSAAHPCSTNLSLWQASWRYRVSGDLSQKEVISLFCFFLLFYSADISSYQSDSFLT